MYTCAFSPKYQRAKLIKNSTVKCYRDRAGAETTYNFLACIIIVFRIFISILRIIYSVLVDCLLLKILHFAVHNTRFK